MATKINDGSYFKVAEDGNDSIGGGALALVPDAEPSEPTLSEEAKALLLAGADDRNGHIMHMKFLSGVVIQANSKNFIEDKNPRSRALWEGALEELLGLGFVKALGHKGEIFQMTREGYKMAELLRA